MVIEKVHLCHFTWETWFYQVFCFLLCRFIKRLSKHRAIQDEEKEKMLLTVFCNCESLIGPSNLFAFYQYNKDQAVHLSVKIEKRNSLFDRLRVEVEQVEKKKKFTPNIIYCMHCAAKLGRDTCIGPNGEAIICLSAECIYFKRDSKRIQFDGKNKWRNNYGEYDEIEYRDFQTFYGTANNAIKPTTKRKFLSNVYPNPNEIYQFNIATLTNDLPRTYQTELYIEGKTHYILAK
jgi:hypothetical protein